MGVSPQMADLSFGARMRIARLEAGLSIRELAARLGKARETVGAWENDHQDPGVTMLRRIAEELDVSADWLLFAATRVFLHGKSSASLKILQGNRGDEVKPVQGVLARSVT